MLLHWAPATLVFRIKCNFVELHLVPKFFPIFGCFDRTGRANLSNPLSWPPVIYECGSMCRSHPTAIDFKLRVYKHHKFPWVYWGSCLFFFSPFPVESIPPFYQTSRHLYCYSTLHNAICFGTAKELEEIERSLWLPTRSQKTPFWTLSRTIRSARIAQPTMNLAFRPTALTSRMVFGKLRLSRRCGQRIPWSPCLSCK